MKRRKVQTLSGTSQVQGRSDQRSEGSWGVGGAVWGVADPGYLWSKEGLDREKDHHHMVSLICGT